MKRRKIGLVTIFIFYIFPLILGVWSSSTKGKVPDTIDPNQNLNQFNHPYSNYTPIQKSLVNPIAIIEKGNTLLSNPYQTIEYNVLTQTEILGEESVLLTENLEPTSIEPFLGHLEEFSILKTSYPFPPDDREKVTSTTSYPWRTICKLYITAADESQYIGSGFFVDEFHILTCGHCVYIHDHGGWISELEIVPGMDGYYRPYGTAYATYFRSYTGWTMSEMQEHDWALVTLDRSIGAVTGWMGRRTESYTSSIYIGTLNLAGYPGDLEYGEYMYYDSDTGEDADEYNHWYWMDMAGGQSGSPVWQYDGENRYILSINAYGYENGAYANKGTRLNSDKFNQLNTWLSEDGSSVPGIKPDLVDRDYYSYITTDTVTSGETQFGIYCDVLNEGTATADSFKVNFYASPDLSVSVFDYLIGSIMLYDLEPFEYSAAVWSGVFPSNVPEGYYYIGWIIDADNEIDELNENNNHIIDSYLQIHVIGQEPSVISPVYIALIIVGTILLVLGLAFAITWKRVPDLRFLKLSTEDRERPTEQSRLSVPPKAPIRPFPSIKFCPMCGHKTVYETQKFCTSCGYDFNE